MSENFIVKRVFYERGRRVESTGIISGPDAFSMALRQAEFWATNAKNKHVQILKGHSDDCCNTITVPETEIINPEDKL